MVNNYCNGYFLYSHNKFKGRLNSNKETFFEDKDLQYVKHSRNCIHLKKRKKSLLRINEYVLETKSRTTIFALERKFCDFSFIQV